MMKIHFVTAEIDFRATPAQMHSQIEAHLRSIEPLRWAIVNVDMQRQKKSHCRSSRYFKSDTLARL